MHKIEQIPILKFVVPYLIGIVVSTHFPLTVSIVVICNLCVLASFTLNRHLATHLFIVNSFFLLSWLVSIPNKRENLVFEQKLSGKLEVNAIWKQTDEKVNLISKWNNEKLIIYLQQENCLIAPGDLLEVHHIQIAPLDTSLQNEFQSYHQFLYNKGVRGIIFLNTNNIISHQHGSSFLGHIYTWRYWLTNKIHQRKCLQKERESVFLALLFGEKSYLDSDIKTAYRYSGVIHVLAISGLHVGMVYLFLQTIFRIIRIPSKGLELILIISTLGMYALISGFGPSVLRAVLMCILLQIGQFLQQKIKSLNIVLSSALFLLVFDPLLIHDIGFQLSYGAVLSIVYFGPYYRAFLTLTDSWFQRNITRRLLDLCYLSLSASVGTFPILLFHFNEVFYASIWNSILIVPLITLTVFIGLSAVITLVIPSVSNFLLTICDAILSLCNQIITRSNSIGIPTLNGQPSLWTITAFFIFILVLTSTSKNKKVFYAKITFSLFCLMFSGTIAETF